MDYEDFLSNNNKFESWYGTSNYDTNDFVNAAQAVPFHLGSDDMISFSEYKKSDKVNSPAHYTRGSQEAIDIIEEAIQDAPDVKAGMLQGQVLKYLLRLWLKDNPEEDAKKARWYLNRLISKLDS